MAKVERRHRETALASVYGDDWADAPWEDVRELRMAYAETGRDGRGGKRLLISPEPFAQALADFEAAAEARGNEAGRLAEREDAMAYASIVAESHSSAYEAWRVSEAYINCRHDDEHPGAGIAESISRLRSELERGEHIGAARKKAGE